MNASRLFALAALASAAVALAIIAWFNIPARRSIKLSPSQAALLLLPWLVFFVSFTLWGHARFAGRIASKGGRRILVYCTALFTAMWLAVFAGIYGHFIFKVF
jgi:hypothetical protein